MLHYLLAPIAVAWTAANIYYVLASREEPEIPKETGTPFLVDSDKLRAKLQERQQQRVAGGEGRQGLNK